MDEASNTQTSATLLGRLQQSPTDEAAWGRFVERYGPQVYEWCRHWGLQEADARDVTRTSWVTLLQQLRTFAYDPARGRFRSWLKTVAHHTWGKLVASRRRVGAGSGDSAVVEVLAAVEAREDLAQRLEEEFDRELLEQATERVRRRVQARTWEAFHLTAVEGLSGAEAAQRLGLKVATVFVARSKVQKMLQEELHQLEEKQEPP